MTKAIEIETLSDKWFIFEKVVSSRYIALSVSEQTMVVKHGLFNEFITVSVKWRIPY